MSAVDEAPYFLRRAKEARNLAHSASDDGIRAIHLRMARSYTELAEDALLKADLQALAGRKVETEATMVSAKDGAVVLDGPDGIAVSMTPAAASKTAMRLRVGAVDALDQQIEKEILGG